MMINLTENVEKGQKNIIIKNIDLESDKEYIIIPKAIDVAISFEYINLDVNTGTVYLFLAEPATEDFILEIDITEKDSPKPFELMAEKIEENKLLVDENEELKKRLESLESQLENEEIVK